MKNKHHDFLSILLVIVAYGLAFLTGWLVIRYLNPFSSPLVAALIADIAATVVIFIFSLICNNSSFYDPYWSLIPIPLFLFWAVQGTGSFQFSLRTWFILAVVFFWGIRLTINWVIGWQGLKHEDWRYVQFRNKFGRLYWLVSLGGIHLFPTLMVFAVSLPVYAALVLPGKPFNLLDIIAFLIALTGILFELISDYQLKRHLNTRKKNKAIRSGLWKFSRHPNYFGEILFWVGLFVFSVASDPLHYRLGLMPAGLIFMFVFFSIPVMEKRNLERREGYRHVMDTVSSLIPLGKRLNPKQGRPLRQRKGDIFYIVIFSFFAITSFVTDSLNGLNPVLDEATTNPVEKIILTTYALKADPALIANQPTVRVSAGISAFLWGPLYLFFIIGFVKGWNIIRNWGFLYGCALSSSMILYMSEGLFGAHASPDPFLYLITNGAYFLVPLSMIIRMWKEKPFGQEKEISPIER